MRSIKVGASQYEIIAASEYTGRILGADHLTFDMIGYAPEEDLRIVYPPTFRKVTADQVVVFEPLPFFNGYNTEIVGVFVPGKLPGPQKILSEICMQAFDEGLKAAEPGGKISDIFLATKNFFVASGCEGFATSCGHGIGFDNTEYPIFNESCNEILEPGMVFAYHPNISLANGSKAIFGCVYVVTEIGIEKLTQITPHPYYFT